MAFTRRKLKFKKKQIRQASVCRSISERCALGRKIPQYGDVAVLRKFRLSLVRLVQSKSDTHHLNAGGSVYSVYYDLQEVIKDWNDMRFRMLKQVEDVCCGKYHHRRSA